MMNDDLDFFADLAEEAGMSDIEEELRYIGGKMTLHEVIESSGMNKDEWEKLWLSGETDWWPDTAHCIPGSEKLGVVNFKDSGSSIGWLPKLAVDRLDKLQRNGEKYVFHISPGVNAYKIGYVDDFDI